MATTKIWKINKRLDHVIEYTTNIEKTRNSSYGEEFFNLHDKELIDLKSEKECYVSALNCSVETVYKEMILTKKSYKKEGGILGFHAYQSFAEGEVTPELAHKIGVQLANEMWGDRFEVVISTHQNTKHIHNHFVINSVSFKDGKKYYDNNINYARLRRLSDDLCAEYGLSILTEKKSKAGFKYENFYKKYVNSSDYYQMIKDDLDAAILNSYSYKDFLNKLNSMGYEVTIINKIFSIRRKPDGFKVRVSRTFGNEYSKANIIKRIEENFIKKGRTPVENFFKMKNRNKGIYGLFMYYCYLLEVFPKKNLNYKLIPEIRSDLKEFDNLMKQTELLGNNNIITDVDFIKFKTKKEKQLDTLLDRKEKLNYKIKKTTSKEDLVTYQLENSRLSKEINDLRREVKLLYEIEKRKSMIENNIKKQDEENRKEVDRNEFRRGS